MVTITEHQLALFEALHASRKEDFKILNKKDYRGVWTTIVDKYPESAHFVYELLQNADDAEATTVEIILRDDELLFKHNGKKHFDITEEDAKELGDINSITGIGDSTKIESQNKIGKFGVGFKAVFQYSDVPEVYDDVFKFKIENYIIPSLLTHDHPERKSGETLFVFPFKDKTKSHNDISERLHKLQNPLLFLHSLERISWRIDLHGQKGKSVDYIKELTERIEYTDNTVLSRYMLLEPTNISSIFLFSQSVTIKEGERNRNHLIYVGFYYDEEKQRLITDKERNIYCFFPTKATFKTCFVSHAPFLLIDNRQDLKPSEDINEKLCNNLANLAANAILHLRDYGIKKKLRLIDENIFDIIPPFNEDQWWNEDEYFEKPIHEEFGKILRGERLLLTRNNNYVSLKEAYLGSPRELVDLVSKNQFYALHLIKSEKEEDEYYNYYEEVDEEDGLYEVKNVDFLKWELSQKISNKEDSIYNKIKTYSSQTFADEITATFMKNQDIRWVTRLYTFLRNTPSLWKVGDNRYAPFRNAPIIKTNKNHWVSPYDSLNNANVFFPIDGKTPSGYNFINQEYLDNPLAMKFFNELEVKQPDETAYITQIILGKFQGDNISVDLDELGKDFNSLLSYYKKVEDQPEEVHFIHELQESLYLYCTDGHLHPIYKFSTYQRKYLLLHNPKLEDYFVAPRNVQFVDIEFYSKYLNNQSGGLLLNFLNKLSVQTYPHIEKRDTYISMLSERQRSLINIKGYKEHHIDDYILDGFLNLCSKKVAKDVSVYIWNVILPSIGFAKYETLTFSYRQPYAQTFLVAYYPSTFKENLQYLPWVYNKQGKLLAPHDIALEDLASEYDLNNGLLYFLGIEKREKSIIDLGGTEDQQKDMELGHRLKTLAAGELTQEEFEQAILEAKAKKLGRNKQEESSQSESRKTPDIKQDDKKLQDILDSSPMNNQEPSSPRSKPEPKSKYETEEEWLEKQEAAEHHNKLLEIAQDPSKRYTMEWLYTLLDMEFDASGEKNTSTGGIKIRFFKVDKDPTSEKSILLRNPNRSIPRSLEEMSNIVVVFRFAQHEDMTITFEVASVQDYVLRLKCKNEDALTIKELIAHASELVTADLNTENPIQLISKLRSAYRELEKPLEFSFKDNINPNIQFVFGPPGTGKTTHLVRKWINKIATTPKGKMLVLCPTNKAADVIAERALTVLNPLSHPETYVFRFVATADERLNNNVCSRQSNIFYQDKCCVISTIARFSYDGFDDKKLREIDWDYIIIDEASMIPLADILYPLYQCSNAKIVIAGDPFQIEPIVQVDEWKDENIYKMVNLKDFQNPKTEPCSFQITNLTTQYRSVPAIGRLFSHFMYGGGVNSDRVQSSQRKLILNGYNAKSVNFVMCPVERGASIYGAQRLMKSNIHIYSALFTYEFLLHLARSIQCQNDKKPWRIGVISPYRAQADLIDKLWEQRKELFPDVDVLISTVHGFQGDECDIIIAVYNPPASGMKMCADDTFVNKQNILNVAISRAQDYLFLLMPDDKYEYFYKMQATRIFKIAAEERQEMTMFESSDIEKVMFYDKDYLAKNTFVTSHQLANVYTEPVSKYEVRFDENSVDIQVKS